jgi:hypothetical protein
LIKKTWKNKKRTIKKIPKIIQNKFKMMINKKNHRMMIKFLKSNKIKKRKVKVKSKS